MSSSSKKARPTSWHTRTRERGAAMVEASLAVPLYLILSFVLLDLCRVTYNKITIQYVGNQLIRDASSLCDLDSSSFKNTCPLNDPASPQGAVGCSPRSTQVGGYLSKADLECYGKVRAQQLRKNAISLLKVLGVQVDPDNVLICNGPDAICAPGDIDGGLPEDLVSISIKKKLRLITLMFFEVDVTVNLKVIGKNEAFYGS